MPTASTLLWRSYKDKGLCSRCGGPRGAQARVICDTCATRDRKIAAACRRKKSENGLCVQCSVPISGLRRVLCETCRKKRRVWASSDYMHRWLHDKALQVKREVMEAYGGACSCCGENELVFLQIDHVNNDGNRHYYKGKRMCGTALYAWLKREHYPDDFQVLCANCNSAKHINGGRCPHQELAVRMLKELA